MKTGVLKLSMIFLPIILLVIILNLVINKVKSEPTTSTLTEAPTPFVSISESSPRWATDSAFLSVESELKTIKEELNKPQTDDFPLMPPRFNFDLGFDQ